MDPIRDLHTGRINRPDTRKHLNPRTTTDPTDRNHKNENEGEREHPYAIGAHAPN
jgi:hypothetical protein